MLKDGLEIESRELKGYDWTYEGYVMGKIQKIILQQESHDKLIYELAMEGLSYHKTHLFVFIYWSRIILNVMK